MGHHNAWTDDEVALLFELHDDEAMDWAEISKHIPGRPAVSCQQKYNTVISRRRLARGERSPSNSVPNAVLIDRERRAIAQSRQEQAAVFFGDPPPGFSALDKRRAQA